MAVITKTFHFSSSNDTNGWVGFVDNARVNAAWYSREKRIDENRSNPPTRTFYGQLRMTVKNNCPVATENYWSLTTTWEDLGVPPGYIVSDVKLDYLFRWKAKKSGTRELYHSKLEFGGNVGSGPAELRDVEGDLIGTFSTRSFCIDRTNDGNLWNAYPNGGQTTHPITQTPMWKVADGNIVNITNPVNSTINNTPSNTTIEFRLNNSLPSTPEHIFGSITSYWLRYQTDTISVTITALPTTSNISPIILMSD